MKPDFSNLIKKEEALSLLLSKWNYIPSLEWIPLSEASGRILAKDQYALYDLPVVRASAMDGIAVKSEYFKDGMPDTSDWKLGTDYVRADTGDDFDDDFDAVIAIENVALTSEGNLSFLHQVNATRNFNVRPGGCDIKKDSLIAVSGTQMNASCMAALAMGGIEEVPVIKKPVIAFIPTGSELVSVGTKPKRGQNIDSNSILVRQMLLDMGAHPILSPIIPDEKEALEQALDRYLPDADMILVNAGSSKGGEDFCHQILSKRGTSVFSGIAAVPGRPMNAVIIDNKPVINLAGPSFGAFYGMDSVIRELICHCLTIPVPVREKVTAKLTAPLVKPPFFSLMAPIHLERKEDGSYLATPITLRGPKASGSCAALQAEGIYITEPKEQISREGETIQVELLVNRSQIKNYCPH
ncbi:MAG: molybdopterin molybdotransferase MoeA [Lachnospiraceae bacterium]|nr:molybdopterin molybdotransferase MoeA [Lachnospiraceae bacterium]